jgi:hypothetical protein
MQLRVGKSIASRKSFFTFDIGAWLDRSDENAFLGIFCDWNIL